MTEIQLQILALNRYARNEDYFSDGWATTTFARTFKAAMAACADALSSTMGVRISWSTTSPGTLCVTSTSIVSDRTQFLRELPLEGDVAAALLKDLQDIAVLKARKDILDERERALMTEATLRVLRLLQQAAKTPAEA